MFWYYHTYVLQIKLLSSAVNIAKKKSVCMDDHLLFNIGFWLFFLLSFHHHHHHHHHVPEGLGMFPVP